MSATSMQQTFHANHEDYLDSALSIILTIHFHEGYEYGGSFHSNSNKDQIQEQIQITHSIRRLSKPFYHVLSMLYYHKQHNWSSFTPDLSVELQA